MPATATPADHLDAARIAEEAGRLLLAIRTGIDGFELPSVIKDEGDRRSHELIAHQLAESHPGDAVLSEEGVDDPRRLHTERVWIVDPLDGTREFGEPPRTDWAVHVALGIDGTPVAGAVALPARGLVLSAGNPPRVPPAAGTLRVAVSRPRPPVSAQRLVAALGGELVPWARPGPRPWPSS